jgi:hypothetical protein
MAFKPYCEECSTWHTEIEGHVVKFDRWIQVLREDVIEGEFGYEPGEFAVYREHWRPMFKEGLTPRRAWQRALDGFAQQRIYDAATRAEQYVGILMHDAAAIAAQRSSH